MLDSKVKHLTIIINLPEHLEWHYKSINGVWGLSPHRERNMEWVPGLHCSKKGSSMSAFCLSVQSSSSQSQQWSYLGWAVVGLLSAS